MEMSDCSQALPPGWDTKYDFKTGRRYFVNYITKNTSLEDPRIRYKFLQSGESSSISTFQSSPSRSMSSQVFLPGQHDLMLSSGVPSPMTGRSFCSPMMGSNALHYFNHKTNDYQASETSVAKIKAIFPTADEAHIRSLLQKYHYREAVVMSALQVEKHAVTMPGPYSSPIPSARHIIIPNGNAGSASASPIRCSPVPSSLRCCDVKSPRHSPKMKLRYLKSLFPSADETAILDSLSNSGNNVVKASEALKKAARLVQAKKAKKEEEVAAKKSPAKKIPEKGNESAQGNDGVVVPLRDPNEKIVRDDLQQKNARKSLKDKFPNLAEKLIDLALESSAWDEATAAHILSGIDDVHHDDNYGGVAERKKKNSGESRVITADYNAEGRGNSEETVRIPPDETDYAISPSETADDSTCDENVSVVSDSPDENKIEIVPYISKYRVGAKGPNKSLLGERIVPKGPNVDWKKGPRKGLARGSIYSLLKKKSKVPISETITRDGNERDSCVIS